MNLGAQTHIGSSALSERLSEKESIGSQRDRTGGRALASTVPHVGPLCTKPGMILEH